jgi:phosphoglycolate phosphatase-like HAD superfamily hydrolase
MMQTTHWLVLFDIDGTLLHSEGCGRAATELAMQDVFGTAGLLDAIHFAGKTDWQILRESLEPGGTSPDDVQSQLSRYDQALARRIDELIVEFPVRPCVGAPDVVAALRTRPDVVIGLVTGNMAGIVAPKLRAAGYDPADFKIGAFGSEGWERGMLPPLALQRARDYAGVDFAPEQIVIIGDTPSDIACAASVGARTIAVATGPFSVAELQAHNPTYAFESMADHAAVLAAIFDGRAR